MFRRRDEVLKFLAGRVDGIELKGKRGNDLRRRKGEERRGKKERREGKIRGAKWMEEEKKREERAKGGCGGSSKDGGKGEKERERASRG